MKTVSQSGAIVTVSPLYAGGEDALDARPVVGTYTTLRELTGRFRASRPLLLNTDGRQSLTVAGLLPKAVERITGPSPLLSCGPARTLGSTEWAVILDLSSRAGPDTPVVDWVPRPTSLKDRCDRCLASDLTIDVRNRLICDRCGVVGHYSPAETGPVSHLGLWFVVLLLGLLLVFIAVVAK